MSRKLKIINPIVLAKSAYTAYREVTLPSPPEWDDLPPTAQHAWTFAVSNAMATFINAQDLQEESEVT